MTLRDDLARVVAERRAANPRNEPGHVDYGIADAVLSFVEEARVAELERVPTRPRGCVSLEPPTDTCPICVHPEYCPYDLPRPCPETVQPTDSVVALGVEDNQPAREQEEQR